MDCELVTNLVKAAKSSLDSALEKGIGGGDSITTLNDLAVAQLLIEAAQKEVRKQN